MKRKLLSILLMYGVILSPIGAYALHEEGESEKLYRVPVTKLLSGEFQLLSGVNLPATATAEDVFKKMTQEEKDEGEKYLPRQADISYIEIISNGSHSFYYRPGTNGIIIDLRNY